MAKLVLEGGKKGFILDYKVHITCYTSSELPLAFTNAPCSVKELFIKPLLEKLNGLNIGLVVLADVQYDPNVMNAVKTFGAEVVNHTGKAPRSIIV
jgi:hypothetical protein